MKPGDSATLTRRFAPQALDAFARLCGAGSADRVPEPLIGALFSCLLGVELPGRGTNYLKQDLVFLAVARPGATLTARVEITRLRPEKHLIDLDATCMDETGRLICRGRALVMARG